MFAEPFVTWTLANVIPMMLSAMLLRSSLCLAAGIIPAKPDFSKGYASGGNLNPDAVVRRLNLDRDVFGGV